MSAGGPRRFRFRASVWQAEVDGFGELRTSTLVKFLQETATRASTDAGFDPTYYERVGGMWLVRRTMLEIVRPPRYGEDIEATTWVADFRRVRSRRDYEVHADGALAARAHTDWVYVDRVHAKPRRIPAELERGFVAEQGEPLPRTPFPERAPPSGATHSKRRVELHDLDALRHVNNAHYVHYVEQAALDALEALGWTLGRQLDAGGRFRPAAHDLEYLESAEYGDEVSLVTWALGTGDDSVTRHTLISRDGMARPLLHAESRYAWVDAASAAARPMPGELREALARSAG